MKLYKKFIVASYLKNFFIIFFSLQLFYTAVEVVPNLKYITDSANLKVLFFVFKFLNAINFTLPLSIIFALIASKFQIIRTNELLSIYASGIGKNEVIKPIFIVALFISSMHITLNMTEFVYANTYADNIKSFNLIQKQQNNIFLKHFDTYVYFEKFDRFKKEAINIQVYKIKDNQLEEMIKAKVAKYKDKYWEIVDAQIIKKVVDENITKLVFTKKKSIKLLEGFKPQIIKSLYAKNSKSAISIIDAVWALILFKDQKVDTGKIRASLYKMVFFPLFAPFFIIILFYKLPISIRFFNITYMTSIFIISSLLSWGILFFLIKISINSVIMPEIGIILPIFSIGLYSLYLYLKK